MPTVLLPITPGTLPAMACYNSEQERLVAFAEVLWAQLNGQAFYNFGPDKPDPEFNEFPWYNTTLGVWFTYSGGWISPVGPQYDLNIRQIWEGNTTDLQTYDSGDTGTPSDRSGPMWEVATSFAARFPVGVGTFAASGAVAVSGIGGEDKHLLTSAELPQTQVLPVDGNNAVITVDTTVQKSGEVTNLSSTNGDFTGTDSGGKMTNVSLRLQGGDTAHNNLVPFIGVYFIKWSGRLYRFIP